MTVKDLIDKLRNYYQYTEVTIWVDGERYELSDVDDSFIAQGIIELNAKTEI